MKSKLLLLSFLLSTGLFLTGISSNSSSPGDSTSTMIRKAFDGFMAELIKIERQIKNNSDVSKLSNELEKVNAKIQANYNNNITLIEADVILLAAYNDCDNKCIKLQDTIEVRKKAILLNDFLTKLRKYDTVYRQMELDGKMFLENKNQKSLDSLKLTSAELWGEINAEMQENKKLIEGNEQLKSLCDTIKERKRKIDALTMEKSTPILEYVWKIVLPLTLAFFVFNMIWTNYKNKKIANAFKGNNKRKKTPAI